MVSDIDRIARALQTNEAFLRNVIDTDPNFIFVKNREGQFVLANKAVADVYGTTIEEIVGKTDRDFNPQAEEVQHFESDDVQVIDKKVEKTIPAERITDTQGKVRWLKTTKRPIQFSQEGPVYVLGVSTDITEARVLQDQLAQAQKMEAIGQLAGGIAHDFNNILTAILGFADLLRFDAGNPEVKDIAGKIGAAAQSARELTGKLLGFARRGKDTHLLIDLNSCVRDTASLIQTVIDKSIQFEQNLSASPVLVKGDATQLQQVVMNLALNARDAMSKVDHKSKILRIKVSALKNARAELVVSDTGCGISEQIISRIYEPFFTTKSEEHGTGLGLSMVYGIVRNHGGDISVESKVGQGTTFRIVLPLSEGVLVTKSQLATTTIRGFGRILVVDDNPTVLSVSVDMLKALGYSAMPCASSEEALQLLAKTALTIDLVISDLMMPGTSGVELSRKLRTLYPGVKIILSTGYGHNELVQQGLDVGVDGFIRKPYRLEEFSALIAQVLHDKTVSTHAS